MLLGSLMRATSLILPWDLGRARASMPNVRAISDKQLGPEAIAVSEPARLRRGAQGARRKTKTPCELGIGNVPEPRSTGPA